MQLSISGHHVEVTSALKSYVTDKLQRLERHFDHITNVHVGWLAGSFTISLSP